VARSPPRIQSGAFGQFSRRRHLLHMHLQALDAEREAY